MWILVTGFGEFGTITRNPSWLAVKALPSKVGDVEIVKLQLRVSYKCLEEFYVVTFPKLCLDHGNQLPALICHCGVAADSKSIRLERVAYNKRVGADVDSQCPPCPEIDPTKPVDQPLYTSVDVSFLAHKLTDGNVRAIVSTDPGRYLCNYSYYLAIEKASSLAENDDDCCCSRVKALFVHFPLEGNPLSIAEMTQALLMVFKNTVTAGPSINQDICCLQ